MEAAHKEQLDMALPDFSGARPWNAGDSFHELWALHTALALVESRGPLTAVTVEGIPAVDSVGVKDDAWNGVDCGLYFGGETFDSANRIELIQLKYSSATPDKNWTVAYLTASTSTTKDNSVMRRLADQFIAAHIQRRNDPSKQTVVRFITNRPISAQITS